MYFGPQNSEAIDAMIGVGSANWPDILEAQAFNAEYGLYISAPEGTSKTYPSHLGGFFICSNGIHKFYNVTSKSELEPSYEGVIPPYKVSVNPTEERNFEITAVNSEIHIIDPGIATPTDKNGYFLENGPVPMLILQGVSPKIFNKLFQIDYDEILDGAMGVTNIARYDGIDHKFVPDDTFSLEGVTFTDQDGKPFGDPAFLIPSDPTAKASYTITFADFDLQKALGEDATDELITKNAGGGYSKLLELLTTGFCKIENGKKFNIGFALQDAIHLVCNVNDDCYFYVMQKSLTEKKTNIFLSSIEYDKYRYDYIFDYYKVPDFSSIPLPTPTSKDYMAFYTQDPDKSPVIKIYGRASLNNPQVVTDTYEERTDDFSTQYVTFAHPRDFDNDPTTFEPENGDLYHKIWYVDGAKLTHCLTYEEVLEEKNGDVIAADGLYETWVSMVPPKAVQKNPNFNTITFSCSEEVYAGRTTEGGSFTGSLDELGTDQYGTNIYFQNILTDDDFSFVECRVIKPFGDEKDDHDNGFWTKTRIIDPYDLDVYEGTIDQVNFQIEGDRYCDFVMNKNLLMRRTGGAWTNDYAEIIRAGLKEFLNPDYDDCYIFMEPTGQDTFAKDLGTIRVAQEFATIISPYMPPSSAIKNGMLTSIGASKIVVPARHRGVARYVGEFEVFDTITSKKYWCQPIGDVGLMLARIMDKKLGVWAPAWMNTGDLGGQLSRAVLRSRYGFDDSSIEDKLNVTHILDAKGLNPIAYNSEDGIMILSSKTTEDPYNLSQWCFLEGLMGFDMCKRHIRDNVMRLQIKKPINDFYFDLRKSQVDAILGDRLSGSNPLWYSAVCDIKGVNDELSKKQRVFKIRVECRPTIFAETVELSLHVVI